MAAECKQKRKNTQSRMWEVVLVDSLGHEHQLYAPIVKDGALWDVDADIARRLAELDAETALIEQA